MKILNCPLNGPRNISEFVYGGEVTEMPDPNACSDREWADYVLMENNTAGVIREWWYHVATAYWIIAERNTVTDEIVRTYPAGELFKERVEFAEPATEKSEPAAEKTAPAAKKAKSATKKKTPARKDKG